MYEQFFVMFAMIFTGYLLRKINFIKEEMNNSLNKFIVYCAYPLMLTYNIGTMDINGELFKKFIMMMVLSGFFITCSAAFARIYTKIRRYPARASNVAEMAMSCPNNGFMGFPMALSFLGGEGLLLMMAQNATLNIFFFTYALYALRRNNPVKNQFSIKSVTTATVKVILNPNILGLIIGLVLCLIKFPIDNGIGVYMNYIGGAATPMAMIFIGSTLAGSKFWDMLRNRIVWESSLIKLIIFPFTAAVIVYFMPIATPLKVITVLGLSFPTAATVPMLAEQEKQNHELASKILFFSTVVSMATVPFTITLIKGLLM